MRDPHQVDRAPLMSAIIRDDPSSFYVSVFSQHIYRQMSPNEITTSDKCPSTRSQFPRGGSRIGTNPAGDKSVSGIGLHLRRVAVANVTKRAGCHQSTGSIANFPSRGAECAAGNKHVAI